MLTLAAAIGVGRFVYTPILPLMAEALGWSKFAAGLVASANFAGYLAGALLAAGFLPGSRRAWLLAALLASALTTALTGAVVAIPAILVLRFAGGVASAFALILVSAVVLEALAETRREDLSSVLFAGVGAGIAASAALVSLMRTWNASWAELWVASGIISLAAAAIAARLLPPDRGRAAARRTGRPAHAARGLARFVAAYGLFGFGYVITATFLVAIVRADPAVRSLEPAIWIVFGLAAVPSVSLWRRAAGPLGLNRAYTLACLIEAAGVLVSVAWRSEAGVFVAALLVGGTFMGLTSLGLMQGRMFAVGDSRRVLALMTSAFGLGQIVGPSFAGALSDRLGSFAVPSAVAAAALVLAGCLTVLPARE